MKRFEIPTEVLAVIAELERADFSAYLVGGCVRDIILGMEPKDWDVATNATPEEIQKVFFAFAGATADRPATVYENQFGTVGVKTNSEDERLKVIEVTTFRIEGKYTDKRHPDEVRFAKTVEEDLSRRDFTINALALSFVEGIAQKIIDPFGGTVDLKNRIIRTVGDPSARFGEDALRLMRAVRLAVELDFQIELKTRRAIEEKAGELEMIAKERIRDEFIKIVESHSAARGVILLEELGLLRFVCPELSEGVGVGQNKHHIYTVFEHNVRALDYAAGKDYSLLVRLASLFHDIGKPGSKKGDGPDSTFYNHEYIGARLAAQVLDRLKFPKDFSEKVVHLVRNHLFYYNVGEVSESGVRRFLLRVGIENLDDLIHVREADRIGSGVPKAVPYKIRHLLFMIEKVRHDPISPKMLKVKGDDIIRILSIVPGPRVGWILGILLEEVLEEPKRNTKECLAQRVRELGGLSDAELREFAERAHHTKEEFEGGVEEEMKKKYHVS